MLDLPALGKPTNATSATVLSSRVRSAASPGSPSSANPGARRRGDAQHGVLAAGAVAVAAGAGPAVARLLVRVVVEVQQRVHAGVHLEDDVPAVAPVAPVGAAERLELLAVDRRDAVPAVAGGDVHDHAVDESGHLRAASSFSVKRHERTGRWPVRSCAW